MSCDRWPLRKIDPGTECAKGKIDPGSRPLHKSSHRPVVARVDKINAPSIHIQGVKHRRIQQAAAHSTPTRSSLYHHQKLHHVGAATPIELQHPAKPLFGEDSEHERSIVECADRMKIKHRVRDRHAKPAAAGLSIERGQECLHQWKLPNVELTDVRIIVLGVGPQQHVHVCSRDSSNRRHWCPFERMLELPKCTDVQSTWPGAEKFPVATRNLFRRGLGINNGVFESSCAVRFKCRVGRSSRFRQAPAFVQQEPCSGEMWQSACDASLAAE